MLSPQVSILSHTQCRELGCRRRYNHLPCCGKRLVRGRQSCERHKTAVLRAPDWSQRPARWGLAVLSHLDSASQMLNFIYFWSFVPFLLSGFNSPVPVFQSTCDSRSDISLVCLPDIPRRPANVLELCAKQERTGSEWTFAIEDCEVWDLFLKGFYKDFTAF